MSDPNYTSTEQTKTVLKPNGEAVTPLPERIRHAGDGLGQSGAVILTQLMRKGTVAVYERRRERDNRIEGYEVIRIRTRQAEHAFGREYVAREAYPTANQFGRLAKFCGSLQRAEEIFDQWTNERA